MIDTNIVFSTLLNPYSSIGEILMNVQDQYTFFAPDLLKDELKRYTPKIIAYSRLNKNEISGLTELILSTITFVSEQLISERSWVEAFNLTKDIDEDDTPFIALTIELNTKLWTGDKVLTKGLNKKGATIITTVAELKKI